MFRKTNLKHWVAISVFLLAVSVGTSSVFATGTYDGGDGSQGNPFQINTPAQMDEIGQHSEDWGSYFILTADIDLSGYTGTAFNIIGNSSTKFTGSFDGDGHRVSNLNIIGGSYLGLFGRTGASAAISNLGMEDVNITGNSIEDFSLGGLVGYNSGSITNCYATGSVTGGDNCESIAGLVGECYGLGEGSSSIVNCYAICSITGGAGSSAIGGLVGDGGGIITNCYAAGTVTGHGSIGGLTGTGGIITNCYFLDPADGGGPDNGYGEPLTTEQMKQQSSFIGWDFVSESANGSDNYWRLCVDGIKYPELAWQSITADLACPAGVDFGDFSFFASRWREIDCDTKNNCGGSDMDLSTDVGLSDLQLFLDNWLAGL